MHRKPPYDKKDDRWDEWIYEYLLGESNWMEGKHAFGGKPVLMDD